MPNRQLNSVQSAARAVPNSVDPETLLAIWERSIPDAALEELLSRKLNPTRSAAESVRFAPAVIYDGLVVFDSPGFFGGGTVHAPDFLRLFVQLGLAPRERMCELCSGVGYIGYSLLARGCCRTLCCVDIHAKSIEAVKITAESNGISDRVTAYVSDVLSQVPEMERWDMVVCNPPQLLPRVPTDTDTAVTFDPEWTLHRNLYANLKRFMNPGALAMVMEARYESSAPTFEPMITQGGGKIVAEVPARDFRGREDDRYFLVTEW